MCFSRILSCISLISTSFSARAWASIWMADLHVAIHKTNPFPSALWHRPSSFRATRRDVSLAVPEDSLFPLSWQPRIPRLQSPSVQLHQWYHEFSWLNMTRTDTCSHRLHGSGRQPSERVASPCGHEGEWIHVGEALETLLKRQTTNSYSLMRYTVCVKTMLIDLRHAFAPSEVLESVKKCLLSGTRPTTEPQIVASVFSPVRLANNFLPFSTVLWFTCG